MENKFTRITAFSMIIIFIFVLIASRVFYLQVLNGDYYRGMSEAKAEKEIAELPPRGDIVDRNGIKIATNMQSFNVTYSLSLKKRTDEDINNAVIEAVKIIYRNDDTDKINIESLPISYDVKTNTFAFNFKSKNQTVIDKLANDFKEKNKLDLSLNPKDTFYKLSEKFGLISNYYNGKYENKYNITPEIMHKVAAVRTAIKGVAYKQYQVVYIANNVTKQTAFEIQQKSYEMEGISTEVAPLRYYPYKEIGSSFVGYVGKISSSADEYERMGYDVNRELIGKSGLEKVLENNRDLGIQLRGEPGVKYVNVDKFGKVIRETSWRDPIPGDTVVTTIDMKLQEVAEKSFNQMMQDIRDGKLSSSERYPNANRGALVVMDVNSGEILAMVSSPGFDPNLFASTGGIKDPEVYNKLFLPDTKDPYDTLPKPMFNYATQGTAPPGSTFKPLSAIAALEEGKTTPNEIIVDRGIYTLVKGFAGKCWVYDDYGRTHGAVNIAKALMVSCNYYFYEMGRRLGFQKIGEWAAKFGLARDPVTNARPSTGIEIYESTGMVGSPREYKLTWINSRMDDLVTKLSSSAYGGYALTEGTNEYKAIEEMMLNGMNQTDDPKYKSMGLTNENDIKKAIESEYRATLDSIGIINEKAKKAVIVDIKEFDRASSNPGDPLITAIGQGATYLTPLQMGQYISTLINGGTRYKAHLVKKVLNPDGTVKKEFEPEVINKINLNPKNVEAVKEGMKKVTEEGGTAAVVFRNYPIPMGGKTGTAQFSRNQAELGRAAYGWFVAFAPYDKPQIAVVGVVYDGGHGMYVARSVKDVFDQYFGIGNPLEELNKRLQENQDKLNQQQNTSQQKNVTGTP